VFKYKGVIKHAKRRSNTKKSFLYARENMRVKFGVQIHSNRKINVTNIAELKIEGKIDGRRDRLKVN